MFLRGKVNSVHYIAQINTVLLTFLRSEGGLLFKQNNARPLTAAAMQRALRGVHLRRRPARTPDLSSIEQVWYIMKWELFFLKGLSQPLRNCDNGCKMLGTIYCWMTFGTFKTVCIREYTTALPPEGEGYTVYWCHCLRTPYYVMCFIWSEFVFIYSYNGKLSVTSIFNTINLSLKVLHFFPVV